VVPHARVRLGMAIRQHHNPTLRLGPEKAAPSKASESAIMVGTMSLVVAMELTECKASQFDKAS